MPGLHGEMESGEGRVTIRLTAGSDEWTIMETLIEEWCHALRHEIPVPVQVEHDAIFWALYGAVTMDFRGGE
jgi:hypothetical protein